MNEEKWMDLFLEQVNVNSEKGEFFWKNSKKKKTKGSIGTVNDRGYRLVYMKHEGKTKMIRLHRAMFYHAYGFLPKIVDHIDGNTINNSIFNLREATHLENMRNTKKLGVHFIKSAKRWRAVITINGKTKYLGQFKDKEDAITARREAEQEYFGQFSRKNVGRKEQGFANTFDLENA